MSSMFKVDRGPLELPAKTEPTARTVPTDKTEVLAETAWMARTGWTVRPENEVPRGPKDRAGNLDPRDHPGRLVPMLSHRPPPNLRRP